MTHPNCILIVFIATLCVAESDSAAKCPPSCAKGSWRHDFVNAVGAAAAKDCGCGSCAAKGYDPCDGKNCYYCVAKGLVANDCGCKSCSALAARSVAPVATSANFISRIAAIAILRAPPRPHRKPYGN